uniref:Vestigial like family member 4 n=1 Tax=Bos indicus x Bos taurus TaxID=30522 RepID=A0A4W2E9C5_BOBOX
MPWGAPGTQEGRLTSGVRGGWLSRKPARGTLADPGPEPGSPVGGCRRPRCVDGPFLLVPWSGLQTLRGHRSPGPTQASLPAPGSPRAIGGALRRGDDGVVPPLGREGWNDRCEHGHGPLPYPEAVRHSRLSVRCSLFRNKTANGDCRKDPRERSRSPIERAVAPTMSLHSGPLYASLPSLSMEQPLALTKNSLDAGRPAGLSPTLAPVERQQNRPSVITCASASARNCNLSHCPVAHSGCAAGPASYRRTPSSTCDPVVEEHFRRSLGKNYKEPEPAPNSVSITGSVDDHFAKALGDTWLQIKAAKDGASSSPESASRRGQPASPSAHMVSHSHSPSVVS